MPVFEYKAFNNVGKSEKGRVEAETAKAARTKLKRKGLVVSAIVERNITKSTGKKSGGGGGGSIQIFGGISTKEMALFTRQLASLIKANIPLVDALNALTEQIEHPKLKDVLAKVKSDVNEGIGLAKALSAHPKIFDNIFINMIEAGESSGTLGLVLVRLAELKEAQMRLKNKIFSAAMYPVIMLALGVVLTLGIFAFVIPKLTKIFDSMNKPIPATTKILIFVSDQVLNYWMFYGTGAFVAFILFRQYINSKAGRPVWDAFKLKAPVMGTLIRMISLTRFATTMATLLRSGVPILTAMKISRNLVGNIQIARAIDAARENITEGQSIAEPLKKSGEFPPMVTHMIAIGEKTGELPEMLQNIATTYEDQVNAQIERMTSLLEPALIVGMGIMVAFIVVSVFVPLMEASSIN